MNKQIPHFNPCLKYDSRFIGGNIFRISPPRLFVRFGIQHRGSIRDGEESPGGGISDQFINGGRDGIGSDAHDMAEVSFPDASCCDKHDRRTATDE